MENEIILYQPDESVKIEVRLENDTIWLTQQQMAFLYKSSRTNVIEHIKHIYEEGELDESATCRKFRQVQKEGKRHIERSIPFYNLDMIIALGYRIKSIIATKFRIWANDVIKTYLTRGYAINSRFERLENRVNNLEEKSKEFDLVVKTSLPPTEGIFFNGQVFDAYAFTSNLV